MNQADNTEDFANLMEELNNYTTENHTENTNSSNQASEASSAIDLSNLDASPADSNQPVTIAPSADFASSMSQTATTSAAAKDSDSLTTPSHTPLSPLMMLILPKKIKQRMLKKLNTKNSLKIKRKIL